MKELYDLEITNLAELVELAPGSVVENCRLQGLDLQAVSLEGIRFVDCDFNTCNVSSVRLHQSAWRGVHFEHCKLMGMRWDTAKKEGFAVSFKECTLDYSVFAGIDLSKSAFVSSSLREVAFEGCHLAGVAFERCRMAGVVITGCDLRGADFRTAVDWTIHPSENQLTGARFYRDQLWGLLQHLDLVIE